MAMLSKHVSQEQRERQTIGSSRPGQCPGKNLVNVIAIVAGSNLALAATLLHLIPTKVIAHACKPMLHVLRLPFHIGMQAKI